MPKKSESGGLFNEDGPVPVSVEKKPSEKRTTRELGRLIKFYKEHIRPCDASDCVGVIRQIQRLLDKGVTLEEMAIALENYKDDPFRQSQDPRRVMAIRTFFTELKIKQWQKPMPKFEAFKPKPSLPRVDFVATERPLPARPVAIDPVEEASDL